MLGEVLKGKECLWVSAFDRPSFILHLMDNITKDYACLLYTSKKFRYIQNNERTEQDAVRFAGLKPVTATIRVDAGRVKPISEH